jgi:hypothetical protein
LYGERWLCSPFSPGDAVGRPRSFAALLAEATRIQASTAGTGASYTMLCAVPCLAALTRGLSAVQVAGSVVQQQASWRAASTLPEDYDSLVIRGVQDSVASVSDPVPDKEAGMCAGVPLETYQRKVGMSSSGDRQNTRVLVPFCPRAPPQPPCRPSGSANAALARCVRLGHHL